jgi:hypothetical protein
MENSIGLWRRMKRRGEVVAVIFFITVTTNTIDTIDIRIAVRNIKL